MQRALKLEFLNEWNPEEFAKDNLKLATCLFKLSIELQYKKGKEVCNEIVH